MNEKNSKLLAIFLAILAIIVVVVSIVSGKKDNNIDDKDASIVNNASKFFTVNSCMYRVTNYIYKKDTSSLMNVLSNKYKKDNEINETNILNKLPQITQNSTFVSKKMYYKEISKTITKYYVYGVIRPNILHDFDSVENIEEKDSYFIVILDSEKQVFSIEPYDGKIFMDGDNNE